MNTDDMHWFQYQV